MVRLIFGQQLLEGADLVMVFGFGAVQLILEILP